MAETHEANPWHTLSNRKLARPLHPQSIALFFSELYLIMDYA